MLIHVRSIPAPGHNGRWRAGFKWPSTPVAVNVVDELTAKRDPGNREAPSEITPSELVALRADRLIAVEVPGDSVAAADSMAVNEAKAKASALDVELSAVRLELAGVSEERDRLGAQKATEAAEYGAQIATLNSALAEAKAAIGNRPRGNRGA